MPFTRKTNFRRKRFGRKSRMLKKSNNVKRMMGHVERGLSYGVGLAKKVKFLSGLINVEKKFFQTSFSGVVSNLTSSYASVLSDIPQGDDINNRNGRSILWDSLNIHWSAKISASATNTLLRITIVCDKKPDVGGVNYGTIYTTGGTVLGHIDKGGEGDRFVILRTFLVRLNAGEGLSQTGKLFIGLKGIHQIFDGTGATDREKNSLWIVAISDEGTNFPTLAYDCRLSFYDN